MTTTIPDFKRDLDAFFATQTDFSPENQQLIANILDPGRVISMTQALIANPSILAEIAKRSYVHSQGFRKIILIDDRSVLGYKLRLHTWPENTARAEGAPLAEMKHEHRWHFISRLLIGEFEDHWYEIQGLDPVQAAAYTKFENAMKALAPQLIPEICERLDALEAANLPETSKLVSLSGGRDQLLSKANPSDLQQTLQLSEEELLLVTQILVKYVNTRLPDGSEKYTFDGPRHFKPAGIFTHKKGECRLHPIEASHRLIVDPSQYAATILVTGPIQPGRQAGEFIRTTSGRLEDDVRERRYFEAPALRKELEHLLGKIHE